MFIDVDSSGEKLHTQCLSVLVGKIALSTFFGKIDKIQTRVYSQDV